MAVVRWRFNNGSDLDFTLDINPSKDTGWTVDPVYAEHHPIGATQTTLQIGGTKSRARVAEGITKDIAMRNNLNAMHQRAKVFSLTEHHSVTNKVFIVKLTWDEIPDASN